MNIHLETEYHTQPQFYPVYTPDGRLLCTDLRMNFSHPQSNLSIPQAMLTPQLDISQRILLLQGQITLIESRADFFSDNNINVSVSVDERLVTTLLESDFLFKKMSLLPGLELEIAEHFPDLNAGENNRLLRALGEHFPLALSHYGAGHATSKAVFDGLFTRISLDRLFIQRMMKRSSFEPLFNAILGQIRPYCDQLVVQGADELPDLQRVRHLAIDGIQSALFPAVAADQLERLLAPPVWLGYAGRE